MASTSTNADKHYFLRIRNAKVASSIPASGTSTQTALSDEGRLLLCARAVTFQPSCRRKPASYLLTPRHANLLRIFMDRRSGMPNEMKDPAAGGSLACAPLLLLTSVLLTACGPSVVEQREFPLCERVHFAVLRQVRNPDTGVTELVRRPPDNPQRWDVLCGMTGSGYLYSIRIADVYEDFRVLARDQPLRGKSITLDCYDGLPNRPEAVRWGKSAWLATDDGLYCRIPGEFMTAKRR